MIYSEAVYWTDSNGKLLIKYGTSYPTNVYDNNSLLYAPVQNYRTYLKNELGKTSVDARLITYEELTSLGCNMNENSCKSAPSWVYSTNYWTASAFNGYNIRYVHLGGTLGYYNTFLGLGLRPVITISKSEL